MMRLLRHCAAQSLLRASPGWPSMATRATRASHPPIGIFLRSFHSHSTHYAREMIAEICSMWSALATAIISQTGSSGFQPAGQLDEMMTLASGGAILEVFAQSELAAWKRQVVPWDLGLCVQADLQALRSRREFRLQQFGPKHHVHLVGAGYAGHRQQRADLDLRQCLFVAFARRRGLQGFAVFHETGRHRPKPQARFDGAAAQQDFALPLGHAAQNQQGVLVVDHAAICTYETR